MGGKYEFYPVLIKGVPYNMVVRSVRSVFTADGSFTTLPSTVALSFENQGTQDILLDGVFELDAGAAPYNLGGDLYGRRDDLIKFAFVGVGVPKLVITQDVVKGMAPLEFI